MSTPGIVTQIDPAQSIQPPKGCSDGAAPPVVPPAVMPPEVHIDTTLDQEYARDIPLPDSPDGLSTPGSPPSTSDFNLSDFNSPGPDTRSTPSYTSSTSGTTLGPAPEPGTGTNPGTTSGTASGPVPNPGTGVKAGTSDQTTSISETASGESGPVPTTGTGLKAGTSDPGTTPDTGLKTGTADSRTGHASATSGTAPGPIDKSGTGSNPGKTQSTFFTPSKGEATLHLTPGTPQAHSSPVVTTRRILFTTPSRSGKKRPASPDTSPDLSGQVGDTPSKKVCRKSSVKKTTAKHRLFDQVTPGQAPIPAFEEPMEATPAPPSSTSIADTLVSVTFTLINGLMTQQVGERVTKAFRNYMGSNGVHSAPMIGRQSVSFTIRNALLSKASHFINQSLGLPDLRYTTTNQKQARKSRNTHNTTQHTSKGIIDTHLSKAEFAKKFNMNKNNIIAFKPINSKSGTKQAILTFSTSKAPLHVTSDTTKTEVAPLLLAIHRCYKCQHFGHTHARCRNTYTRCMFCSLDHASGICMERNLVCPNCNFQGHAAGNQFCPALREYKAKIESINQQILSDWEARKKAANHTSTNTPAPPPKPMQASYAQIAESNKKPNQAPAEPQKTPLILSTADKNQGRQLVTKQNLATILKCLLTPDTLAQLQTMTESQREDIIDAVVYSPDEFVLKNRKEEDQVITIDDEPGTTTTHQTSVQSPALDTNIALTGMNKLAQSNSAPTHQNKTNAGTKSPRANKSPGSNDMTRSKSRRVTFTALKSSPGKPLRGPDPPKMTREIRAKNPRVDAIIKNY